MEAGSRMETHELIRRLSVALAIGLLIGLERGWQGRAAAEGERAAGVRTLALSGLLGGVWGALAMRTQGSGGGVALGLAFSAFALAVVVFRFREVVHDKTYGATTVVAALLAFALGAFALLGDMLVAAAAGVAVAALLALKALLHAWVERMTWEELRSGLVLLAMSFVLLPLLPDRTVDPWDALNPHAIWLMTILLAALSFAGYVGIKLTGEDRGIMLTGITGGLVSSTAVTLSLSRLARECPDRSGLLAAGMLASGAVMLLRVLVLVGVANLDLMTFVGPALVAAAAVQAAAAFALTSRKAAGPGGNGGIIVRNPFDLVTVLQFGALLTAIAVASRIAASKAGDVGAYALAAVSGLADVDAITLSMSRLGGGVLTPRTAAMAILIAVAVNTITKVVLCWLVGGPRPGRWMLLGSGVAVAAGLVTLLAFGVG